MSGYVFLPRNLTRPTWLDKSLNYARVQYKYPFLKKGYFCLPIK